MKLRCSSSANVNNFSFYANKLLQFDHDGWIN